MKLTSAIKRFVGLSFVFCLYTSVLVGQDQAFITTWEIPVNATDKVILIPTNPDLDYAYDIDWQNDGVWDEFNLTGNVKHQYDSVGKKTIAIRGSFPAIQLGQTAKADRLISVDQWGTIQWLSFEKAFEGAINFNITASDSPDLSQVHSLEKAFYNCHSLTANLNAWDVSSVSTLENTFNSASSFDQDLDQWNTSNVSNFAGTFSSATKFNGNISGWNISKAISLAGMFAFASNFNQDLSSWNTSNVESMAGVFFSARKFSYSIQDWDIKKVNDMGGMLDYVAYDIDTYDALLMSWRNQMETLPNDQVVARSLGVTDLRYCSSSNARAVLIDKYQWSFSGDLMDVNCNPVATIDQELNQKITVFPNPTTGNVFIKSPNQVLNVQVFDALGRLVDGRNLTESSIDLHRLEKGMYTLLLKTSQQTITKRILKL